VGNPGSVNQVFELLRHGATLADCLSVRQVQYLMP
jgi:hypothetical protein